MAPISPGTQVGPPRKRTKPTQTTKLHRYEPFTKRITRLKIDPVHVVDRQQPVADDKDLSQSYFRASLDEWTELNLSQTFTGFLNKASPLSENLPQLLHHSDRIFELLVEHIEKQDALALEPLLSLVAHLAHDLGQRFEQYFARTVALVARVAASHTDADVVEWSFSCLAWLFKYLSRLLVQDLRPLLDVMVPHLSAKKDYIVRFSAESLAFLLKKAAGVFSRRKAPLSLAIEHVLGQVNDLTDPTTQRAFQVGIITLLSEAARGVDGQLHTGADALVRCLLSSPIVSASAATQLVAEGTLIAIIHESSNFGFQPVLEVALEFVGQSAASGTTDQMVFSLKLLAAVAGTRKGSRILEWEPLGQRLLALSESLDDSSKSLQQTLRDVVSVSAAMVQYAPMSQLLPLLQKLLNMISSGFGARAFFTFCITTAELGPQRFQDLVLPQLQKYILSCWADDDVGLCYLLERLHSAGLIDRGSANSERLVCAPEWQEVLLKQFAGGRSATDLIAPEVLAGHIRLVKNIRFPRDSASEMVLTNSLHSFLLEGLQHPGSNLGLRERLILGWGFDAYLRLSPSEELGEKVLKAAVTSSPILFRIPSFAGACNRLLSRFLALPELDLKSLDSIRHVLMKNLLSASNAMKSESLRMLAMLSPPEKKSVVTEIVEHALEILETPYLPAQARQISMLVRRLPSIQRKVASDAQLVELLPLFSMGLLSSYHDKTRNDVCSAIADMVEHSAVEEMVINISMEWLRSPPSANARRHENGDESTNRPAFFECANLQHIEKISSKALCDFSNSSTLLHQLAEEAHQMENTRMPELGRTLALQVLNTIPASAERRSRIVTPVFLSAPMNRSQLRQKQGSDSSISSHTLSLEIDDHDWSLADRKAFLALIGKFSNSRVLYRSEEVYSKIRDLLANGNAEIRTLALRALLTWKAANIKQYEENLLQVAEDKISSVDLASLLSNDEGQSPIKQDDRETLLPILLRLVFGLVVGRSGSAGSNEARRKSILRNLFRMDESEVSMFLVIALGKLKDTTLEFSQPDLVGADFSVVPEDQQYGFLRLLLSMLEILQINFAPYGGQVVDAVMYCTIGSSHQTRTSASESDSTALSAMARNIRRTGLQCLVSIFEYCPAIDWSPYMPALFANIISPRLEGLAVETSQGISGILRLFASWVQSDRLIGHLTEYDARVPSVVWQCLTTPGAQLQVKMFILDDILTPWTIAASNSPVGTNKAAELLQSETEGLLRAMIGLLETTPPKELLNSITSVLPTLAAFATSPQSKQIIISLLGGLLRGQSYKLPPNVKSKLLLSILGFLSSGKLELEFKSQTDLYDLLSTLFNYFKDATNRLTICDCLDSLAKYNQAPAVVAQLSRDLNAMSADRLDEPDYEKRLEAYQTISTLPVDDADIDVWLPVLHNLIFFVRTHEDFTIRVNSMSSLRGFIVRASDRQSSKAMQLVRTVILPATKRSIKDDSEIIRADFVALFGLVVQHLDDPELRDMTPLLVGNDEEASFFANVLHIQQHRRLRAIRRLESEVQNGHITASNISEFFIPLIEKFVYDSGSDETTLSTKGQSISSMAVFLRWVEWKQFKAIFRRYKADIVDTSSNQKDATKLLGHAADALASAKALKASMAEAGVIGTHLARTLPGDAIIENEVKSHFIPKLADLVHWKDETELSLRLPTAVTAIKLIQMLPKEEIPLLGAPIILDIAHILRSRTQESRDAARSALCQIVTILGSTSLEFVLKELRAALTRGYQLHVVSFTLHAILVTLSPTAKLGDYDYCIEILMQVIMDDIFGAVGQEKDSEDYISSMKEVKKSKSFDSMEILARSTSVGALSRLMNPIQTLLSGNLNAKQARQLDEIHRRIGMGLSQNPAADSHELLIFGYQLIKSAYETRAPVQPKILTNDEKNRQRYLLQLPSTSTGRTSPLMFKLSRFALDLVRSAITKHNELLTAENIHGFLPVIGDALIEGQEDVKISALRLASSIIRLDMPALDDSAPVYVLEAIKILKACTNTNEEAAQAALKLLAAILRERKATKVRDSDIAYVLHRITPDIEEPDRQGVTFNFVRAVMSRKIQLPEIYELVDKVGVMMVTNHSRAARDTARAIYVHFLLEYPQSSSRWTKQQKFLMKNLEYEHPEGRQSVLEGVHTLASKLKGDAQQEVLSTFFIPTLLCMANDENTRCRELAGALLGHFFRLADSERMREMLEPLKSWTEQYDNEALLKVGLQAYGVLLDSDASCPDTELTHIRECIQKVLSTSNQDDQENWDLYFQALALLARLVDSRPNLTMTRKQENGWPMVWKMLTHSNPWIQSTCADLVWAIFNDCTDADRSQIPLTCGHGLRLHASALLDILKGSVRMLKQSKGNEALCGQAVQILGFLARCVDVNGLTLEVAQKSSDRELIEHDHDADSETDEEGQTPRTKIPAIQYLLDQLARILRLELPEITSGALLPKNASLQLLATLVPALSSATLSPLRIRTILLPLQHLTDPNTITPQSADATFPATHQLLIELAHDVMDAIQRKIGDAAYVSAMTEVSKIVRKRREERRSKRRIERVAEPEKAARDKKRKAERKRDRKKEIGRAHMKRRREM